MTMRVIFVCTGRWQSQLDKHRFSSHDKRIDALKRGDTSSFESIATLDQERELHRLEWDPDEDFGEVDQMRDWSLKPTIL